MSGPTLQIRHAIPADLESILELDRATASAPHWAASTYQAILHPAANRFIERCLFVAHNPAAAAIVGFAVAVLPLTPDPGHRIAEIESLAVAESACRRGAGRALCIALLDWSRHHTASTVELEVRAASYPARRLYETLGFQPFAVRPRYYSDPDDDAILMRLELNANGKSIPIAHATPTR